MTMDYLEKLKDPRWQRKRLEIFQRDNWTCRSCSTTVKTLHVHHLFYFKDKEPWEINDGFLITLCEDCHSDKINSERIIDKIGLVLDSLWKHGYTYPEVMELITIKSPTPKTKTKKGGT